MRIFGWKIQKKTRIVWLKALVFLMVPICIAAIMVSKDRQSDIAWGFILGFSMSVIHNAICDLEWRKGWRKFIKRRERHEHEES